MQVYCLRGKSVLEHLGQLMQYYCEHYTFKHHMKEEFGLGRAVSSSSITHTGDTHESSELDSVVDAMLFRL